MFEFAPLILFLAAFLYKDIFLAIIVLMIAAPIGLLLKWRKTGRLDKMYFWSTVFLYPFAGATLYFRDAEFLLWKPTVYYWAVALAFIGSLWIGEKPLVRRVIDFAGQLPTDQLSAVEWRNLNLVWAAFFVAMGALNLYVANNFSLDFWVKFKVFGLLGISFVFIFIQVFWIASKIGDPEDEAEAQD